MNTVEIICDRGKYRRRLPSNWNELKEKDWLKLVQILFLPGVPTLIAKGKALFYMLKLPRKIVSRFSPEQIHEMLPLLGFIFEEASEIRKLEKFRYRGKTYHCPTDRLDYSPIIELIEAEAAFESYCRHDQLAALDRLIACLCRPRKGWVVRLIERTGIREDNGDIREAFDSRKLDKRAQRFKRLPGKIKMAVLYHFIGCYNYFPKVYPDLYSIQSKEGKEEAPTEQGSSPWIPLLFKLGETGLFGIMDKLFHQPVPTILAYLQEKRQEYIEEQNKSANGSRNGL